MILHLCSYHSLVNSTGKGKPGKVSQMVVLTFSSAKADDGMHIANAVKVPTAIFLKFIIFVLFVDQYVFKLSVFVESFFESDIHSDRYVAIRIFRVPIDGSQRRMTQVETI